MGLRRGVADDSVLHLTAANPKQFAYSFFNVLLKQPGISVNLQDYESGYTALHRALYAGNIRAARDLLSRGDIDVTIKDFEGLTAFDLYNSTVEGTNPGNDPEAVGTDLFVWGANRNATLGLHDSTDKAFPDRVNLRTQRQVSDHPDPSQRFFHVGVKDIKMAKLHTGVVTAEKHGNLSVCGFGSGGRLGRQVHSQLPLLPLPELSHTIVSIAMGQDHTLALTSGGYMLSWGNNRFAQLGYAIESVPNPFGKDGDDQIQSTPKRIIGSMKKEWVRGVAAGRMSSACWTADAVWTWGTNQGHLGYDKAATPIQVTPRKVTSMTQPVIDVALSDYAMLCLVDTFEVMCFHHDAHFKINFSSPSRSLKMPKNPAQVSLDSNICKVTSCGPTFATLSKGGDVCTFTLPHPSEEASKDVRDRHVIVKPQVQWALRKSFTAVRDIALGSDGTMIICTNSGHVYVRQRLKAGSGQLKFRRIPYLQRVIKVAANESGAFAAIRVDARPTPIALKGKTLVDDMFSLQPHIQRFENQMSEEDFERHVTSATRVPAEEEEADSNSVARDTVVAVELCQIISRWQAHNDESLFAWSEPLLGSDLIIKVAGYEIPAHSVILSLRSPVLAGLLSGKKVAGFEYEARPSPAISMEAGHPLVALLLLQYLYSDDIAAIWDSRVAFVLQQKFPEVKLSIPDIKADLRRVAEVLELTTLQPIFNFAGKSAIASRSLPGDLSAFFARTSKPPNKACDVVIVLSDREVAANSALLRARCPFFEAMFADRDWTQDRVEKGQIVVNMEHLRWRPMNLVFRFIHEGLEDDLFDYLHQETLDEFLDFVFEVMATATELLMDRLVLVCSRVIATHCNPYNAAALATEASFYQATTLKHSIFDYISSCMETMLESGLLDDMEEDVMRDLTNDIARKQMDKSIVPRSNILVDELMAKHREWVAVQDIPTPRVRVPTKWKPRSPLLVAKDEGRKSPGSPFLTPDLKPTQKEDEIFSMDEDSPRPPSAQEMTPLHLGASVTSGSKPVWKSKKVEVEKSDLRSIMAAEASRKVPGSPTPQRRPEGSPKATGSPILAPVQRAATPSGLSLSSSPGTSGAWRTVEQRKSSLSAVQAAQAAQNPMLSRAPGSLASPAPAGRVINPTKAPTTTPRRTSGSSAAWSTPTTYAAPKPAPPIVSPPNGVDRASQSFSLLAIQQEEQAAAGRINRKVAKSIAEIQEEERLAKEEQAQAEEFERWWQEEERKQAAGSKAGDPSRRGGGEDRGGGRGRGRGRGERRVPHRGRGRGKGDATVNGHAEASTAPTEARGSGGERGGGSGRGGGGGGGRGRGRGKPKAKGSEATGS